MPVYHQMGHQSRNLLYEPQLQDYAGAILSPVNNDRQTVSQIIDDFQAPDFETIFDPQLYYPRTERQSLRDWSYFPASYATVDFSSLHGWSSLVTALVDLVSSIHPDAICSPVVVPRTYSDEYFELSTEVGELLQQAVPPETSVLQTVIVDFSYLADYQNVLRIASIVTRATATRFYLVFLRNNTNPRRELIDTEEIKGAMLLINQLVENNLDVLVGFCSSDVLLWKAAGATACATGKFWNLRRFHPDRWGEPSDGGGGLVAYWFEEALLAFLRESDVLRTTRLFSTASLKNPYYNGILECINQGTPWVGLGWRQFMYWFCDIEARLANGTTDARQLLLDAEQAWNFVEDNNIFMEEPRNNGNWTRPWLRAVHEFRNPW